GVYSTSGNPKRQKCQFECSGGVVLGPAVFNISLDVSSSRPMCHGLARCVIVDEKIPDTGHGVPWESRNFSEQHPGSARVPADPRLLGLYPDAPRHAALARIRSAGCPLVDQDALAAPAGGESSGPSGTAAGPR